MAAAPLSVAASSSPSSSASPVASDSVGNDMEMVTASSTPGIAAKRIATRKHTFVIEHMEPVFTATSWSRLEYDHIREIARVGGNDLLVCAIKPSHAAVLTDIKTTAESITSTGTMAVLGVPPEQVCFLDLRATQTLSPDDAQKFSHFVFGGILGDHPPRDRGQAIRATGVATRLLGPRQMTTDTAVLVADIILHRNTPIDTIPYIDDPELQAEDGDVDHEAIVMPFRYVVGRDGKPILPRGLLEGMLSSMDFALSEEDLGINAHDLQLDDDDNQRIPDIPTIIGSGGTYAVPSHVPVPSSSTPSAAAATASSLSSSGAISGTGSAPLLPSSTSITATNITK